MTRELLSAFLLVFAAEMGDKTQILAMMFATRYKPTAILTGVFIGSFLNHGLAVLLGTQLGCLIPLSILGTIAGVAFIYFAFSSLKPEKEGCDQLKRFESPICTIACAFFIGELGDKTQLAAITLSMGSQYPWSILMGTVGAMVVTSMIGIYVGSKIGKKISDVFIKTFSATLFFVFGMSKLISLFWNKVDILFIGIEAAVITAAFIVSMIKFVQTYGKKKYMGKKSL